MNHREAFEALGPEFWQVLREEGARGLLARYDRFFEEDAEYSPPMSRMAGGHYVGRAGFADYAEAVSEVFERFDAELENLEWIDDHLARSVVKTRGLLRDGSAVGATQIWLTRVSDEGRSAYTWGTYDPDEAERKATELQAAKTDA